MNLEQAMRLVANAVEAETAQVRSALLDLLRGRIPAGLTQDEASALAVWAANQRGDPAELYQQLLNLAIVPTDSGSAVRVEKGRHRRTGAYYTVAPVVQYMVARAYQFCPSATAVIDPACGAGAFLAEVQRAFRPERLAGWDVDPVAIALCRQNAPTADLYVRDALLTEDAGGYDLCLGNPPYISTGLRGAVNQGPERTQALRTRYPLCAQYKLNTYPLFVERGLDLLRDGGVLGYILPDSFLTGRHFAGLRRLLLRHTILELTLIRQDFWAHGQVGQSVILFVRKGEAPPDHAVAIRVCDTPDGLLDAPTIQLPLPELVWGPLDRFRLIPDSSLRRTLRRMETGNQPLSHWLFSYSGLIARKGQASLISPDGSPLLRSGKEIDRYVLRWAGARVCLDPALIKSGGNHSYYRRPKILLRQTADLPRAVYDDRGHYCLNNIHLLLPVRPDANLRALLGILNSTPFGDLYQAVSMEAGRRHPQVDLDLLGSLPIPPLGAEASVGLERLVRQRENAASSEEAALAERAIDGFVRQLYGL